MKRKTPMLPVVQNLLIEAVYWRWRAFGGTTFEQLPEHTRAIIDAANMPGVPTDEEGEQFIEALRLRCLFNSGLDASTEVRPPIVGFTGNRKGMTAQQSIRFTALIVELKPCEFHHGDCVGSDAQAHDLYCSLVSPPIIIGHPPEKNDMRAYCECSELRPVRPYLVRNADIIRESDIMIATPRDMADQVGGTWNTINKTIRAGKPLYIIAPDGRIWRDTLLNQ